MVPIYPQWVYIHVWHLILGNSHNVPELLYPIVPKKKKKKKKKKRNNNNSNNNNNKNKKKMEKKIHLNFSNELWTLPMLSF